MVRVFLILSLVLNAALAAAYFLRKPDAPAVPPPPELAAIPPAPPPPPAPAPPPAAVTAVPPPAAAVVVTNAPPPGLVKVWPYVEADSYRAYIGNLRAIGCPEETIRDIILVDVLKQYTQRLREVHAQENGRPYWKRYSGSTRAEDVARQVLELQLLDERRALFQSLVGRDLDGELASLLGGERDDDTRKSDWLSPARKQALDALLRAYDARKLELIAAANGYPDEATRQALRSLDEERRKAFEESLTPDEKRARDLRGSGNARRLMDGPLAVVEVTEQEYETIFDMARSMHERREAAYEEGRKQGDEKAARAASEAVYAAYNEQLRQVLGDDRYQEYVRGRDSEYRRILDFTRSMQLPRETAARVYEMQGAYNNAVRAVRDNKQLSRDDRNAQLAALRDQNGEQLRQLLGDRAYNSYRQANEERR